MHFFSVITVVRCCLLCLVMHAGTYQSKSFRLFLWGKTQLSFLSGSDVFNNNCRSLYANLLYVKNHRRVIIIYPFRKAIKIRRVVKGGANGAVAPPLKNIIKILTNIFIQNSIKKVYHHPPERKSLRSE